MNTSQADQFRDFNRPYDPPPETAAFLFRLYRFLFTEASIELRRKQLMFEAGADCGDSWRVVCISEDALVHIYSTDSARCLKRAHPISRWQRIHYLFDRDNPLNKHELIHYFFKHDSVALVTAEENNKEGISHWSTLYPVPNGIFTGGGFGVRARNVDLEWVRDMVDGKRIQAENNSLDD